MKRILLVDDDLVFREQLALALQRRGYHCHQVPDGATALQHLQTNPIDAAVIDLRMPGISGIETVQSIHQHLPTARLIVLTGYGSIPSALEAIRLGASDYLAKPVNADHIAAAIEGQPIDTPPPDSAPTLDKVEWEHIQRVLSDCHGNISQAAEVLGIHRRSLQRKLNRYAPIR
ncbi:response regulator [Phragmitibacter flavus]|uniref:Response regulator n=1 Tax=Phragmitibacter flavus TaxID=2576071 RepID=A0A5R8KA78_9BACT|nr:response regulator [Phragmitibacter flavus]TLD69177.1 response regulator [Phragmitibacter flavus]